MEPWSEGSSVVVFPDGRRIRGRSLRHGPASGPEPQFGLYLLGRDPGPMPWPHEWIRWPDFRTPADERAALAAIGRAVERSVHERVEIACRGGRGRTGCALAVAAVLCGVDAPAAVEWVRTHYDRRAVETPGQRRWIRRLTLEE